MDHPAWTELPANVLLRVFQQLDLSELCTAAPVCTSWHAVVGSDSLWASILCSHYGRSSPLSTASNSSRHSLLQLRTCSLRGVGTFKAPLAATFPHENTQHHHTLALSGTELSCLWSSGHAKAAANNQNRSTPFTEATATAAQSRASTPLFAVSAVASGSSHLVLLGCDGRVVDTRGAFVKQQAQPAGVQQGAAATAMLLAWLLQQQHDTSDQGAVEGSNEQAATAVANQRESPRLSMRNPWLPAGGAVITSVASGDGHVLAVAADGRMWGWGQNDAGQLGLGSCSSWQSTPADITAALDGAWKPEGAAVIAAACGTSHSVVLLDTGVVYTAGANSSGQCGQDLQLRECPVFCQPHMAPNAAELQAATGSTRSSSKQREQHRSTDRPDSPTATLLSDPATADEAASASLPHSALQALPAVASIAAAPSNTLLVTQSGRVLVCGASCSGQCGSAWVKTAVCPGFVDMGPEVSWHGLTRPSAAEVEAAGGSVAAALSKVVEVAAGDGTCYALTDAGEVFAWGQGSKGQLGTGGCPKVQATPAKLPWARQMRHISASPTGQFAAAVDAGGKLYTWGAGKYGQLGHGDTSKRTVGRLVKQLRHLDVLQVHCCAESLLVLTAQHIPHTQQPHHLKQQQDARSPQHAKDSGTSDSTLQQTQRQAKQHKRHDKSSKEASAPAGSDASAANLGTSPSSRTGAGGKHTRRTRQQECSAAAPLLEPAADPTGEAAAGRDPADTAALDRLLGDMSMGGAAWQDVEEQGPFFCPAPKSDRHSRRQHRHMDADPNQAFSNSPSSSSRMRRAGSGHSSSSRSAGGGWDDSSGSPASRQPRMDKGFKRLLKRLMTGFMADSSQREMTFPASLSPADRYHVHVAAEAYGLAHSSHNEGSDRVIKVWKMSRSRKSPAITGDTGYGSD